MEFKLLLNVEQALQSIREVYEQFTHFTHTVEEKSKKINKLQENIATTLTDKIGDALRTTGQIAKDSFAEIDKYTQVVLTDVEARLNRFINTNVFSFRSLSATMQGIATDTMNNVAGTYFKVATETGNITKGVEAAVSVLAASFENLLPFLSAFSRALLPIAAALSAIAVVAYTIQKAFEWNIGGVMTLFQRLHGRVSRLIAVFERFFRDLLITLQPFIKAVLEPLADVLFGVIDVVTRGFSVFANVLEGFNRFAGQTNEKVAKLIKLIMEISAVVGFPIGVLLFLADVVRFMSRAFREASERVKFFERLSAIFERVKSRIEELFAHHPELQKFYEILSKIFDKIGEFLMSEAINVLVDGLERILMVAETLANAFITLVNVLDQTLNTFERVGKAIHNIPAPMGVGSMLLGGTRQYISQTTQHTTISPNIVIHTSTEITKEGAVGFIGTLMKFLSDEQRRGG